MKSNFTVLFFLALLCAMSFPAQSQSINRELGIRLSGLDNFDFIYKKGKKNNEFARFRFVFANVSVQGSGSSISSNFGAGFAIGKEYRKTITPKFYFVHGFEPAFSFSVLNLGGPYRINIRPSIGYVLGFQLNVLDNFYMNLETIPSLSAQMSMDDSGEITNYVIGADFSSNAIALSLVYQL
ncbi:MAG: hypothetical protein KDE26_31095 [Bacteroidetes bacterium]|nr:hypothetical protein [Bacteroidota bacterium]